MLIVIVVFAKSNSGVRRA